MASDPSQPSFATTRRSTGMRIFTSLDELDGRRRRGDRHHATGSTIDQDRVDHVRRRHRRPPVDPRRRRARQGRARSAAPIAHGYLTLSLLPVPQQPALRARDPGREAQLRRQQGPLPRPGPGRLAGSGRTSRSPRSPTSRPASSWSLSYTIEIEGATSPPASPRRSSCCSAERVAQDTRSMTVGERRRTPSRPARRR